MGEQRVYDFGELKLIVVDDPHDREIDGWALLEQEEQRIFLRKEVGERLAIELMSEYGLAWWPEPEADR